MARGPQTGGSGLVMGSNNLLANVTLTWNGALTSQNVAVPLTGYYGGPILIRVNNGALGGSITLAITMQDSVDGTNYRTRTAATGGTAVSVVTGIAVSTDQTYGPYSLSFPSMYGGQLVVTASGGTPANGITTVVQVWEA